VDDNVLDTNVRYNFLEGKYEEWQKLKSAKNFPEKIGTAFYCAPPRSNNLFTIYVVVDEGGQLEERGYVYNEEFAKEIVSKLNG
jgi:hypothetical protein